MKPKGAWLGIVVLAGWLVGCGDSGSAAGKKEAGEQKGAGNPLTAPVDYLGAVGAAQRSSAATIDTTSLQKAVQAFQAGEDRLPADLQELVKEGYLPRLPEPPRGMRWAYQPSTGRVGATPIPGPPPTAPAAR
jgi:hypothetical protein